MSSDESLLRWPSCWLVSRLLSALCRPPRQEVVVNCIYGSGGMGQYCWCRGVDGRREGVSASFFLCRFVALVGTRIPSLSSVLLPTVDGRGCRRSLGRTETGHDVLAGSSSVFTLSGVCSFLARLVGGGPSLPNSVLYPVAAVLLW